MWPWRAMAGPRKPRTGGHGIRNRYASTLPSAGARLGPGLPTRSCRFSNAEPFAVRRLPRPTVRLPSVVQAARAARLSTLLALGQRRWDHGRPILADPYWQTHRRAAFLRPPKSRLVAAGMAGLIKRNGTGGHGIAMPCRRRQIAVARGALNAGRRWVWQPEQA